MFKKYINTHYPRFIFKTQNRYGIAQCGGFIVNLEYSEAALVRESIANPCMDFQKSTDINMNIHDFWMSVFNYPYKRGYPH